MFNFGLPQPPQRANRFSTGDHRAYEDDRRDKKVVRYDVLVDRRWVEPTPYKAAVPAKQPDVNVDYLYGWNSGASSIGSIRRGYAEFTIKDVAGAVVGLVDVNRSNDPSEVVYGVRVINGSLDIVRNGTTLYGPVPHQLSTRFRIERTTSNTVRTYADGNLLHEEPDLLPRLAYLDAALYAGGDTVYDPVIVNYAPEASGISLLGALRSTNTSNSVLVSLPGITTKAGAYPRSVSVLPNIISNSSTFKAAGHSFLPGISGISSGARPTPRVNTATAYGALSAINASGELGRYFRWGYGSSYMAAIRYSLGINSAQAVLQPIEIFADGTEKMTQAVMRSVLAVSGSKTLRSYKDTKLHSVLKAVSAIYSNSYVYEVISASVRYNTSFNIQYTYQATIHGAIGLGKNPHIRVLYRDGDRATWVVNTRTGAVSRYEGFGFNSFASTSSYCLATRDDGLYALRGATDDGKDIKALVDFGKIGFQGNDLKQLTNVYIGASSDAALQVRVSTPDEQVYTYSTRSSHKDRKMQRADTGRGLRATYYGLELLGVGADFEVDSIDALIASVGRRI